MKHVSVAGKLIALLLSAAFLVACSGSDTKEDEDAAAAAAAAAARAAQEAAAGSAYGTDAERQRLMDAAAAYGNVFYFALTAPT
jgi:peptidoglycan-associated lipoprotein